MLRSATMDFNRRVSSFSASTSRAFRFASMPASDCSRQPESVAAVTPSSRERVSRSSPRSNRRIAAILRLADQRPRLSRRSSGAPPVALRAPSRAPEDGSLSLLMHTYLVISYSFSSQFSVQENPRAREHAPGAIEQHPNPATTRLSMGSRCRARGFSADSSRWQSVGSFRNQLLLRLLQPVHVIWFEIYL